ncbi:unnamed protein product [Caenorhabditis angaria]|uniref:Uncharacterized protein n=1 Tax=Caenorhabditis angaria TaxID=860376 RepID=A0A9P1MY84_9PELO|nr:unnamed protein product [Caenorhabditis angaria]
MAQNTVQNLGAAYKNHNFEPDDTYLINFQAGPSSSRTSNATTSDMRSEMILEMPVSQLKKIKGAQGTVSVTRETQHFCETTTMHGPKRIFKGKHWATLFWAIMVACSLGLLITQVVILVAQYLEKPVISQVSFLINEEGLDFPHVTVCNLNPIRKSYVTNLNQTGGGDVTEDMITYLMNYNVEILSLIGGNDRETLHQGNLSLEAYQKRHSDFTPDKFFWDGGFECADVLKLCSFEGAIFDCCSLATPILTPMGKCYTLDMSKSEKSWMRKQTEPGISAGLQLTLDAHLEEQFDGENGTMGPLFTNSFVDGFRYFVHPPDSIPHLSSDEFTVSPNSVAYSAITSDRFLLLSAENWGNCTDEYPADLQPTNLSYTSTSCVALCKARQYFEICGCSPALYNLENKYKECNPFETYTCVDNHMRTSQSDKFAINLPQCNECRIECNSLVYRAYNSYGSRLSNGALSWLHAKNATWTNAHMRSNFQMINIFYRDMSYTEYNQVQDASITQLLSDIGGNMGMFLGMSVITITEICLFFSKVFWIGTSKQRRKYMFSKKLNENTRQEEITDTVEKMKVITSYGDLGKFQNSSSFNGGSQNLNDDDRVQFRIDVNQLADQLNNNTMVDVKRSRY